MADYAGDMDCSAAWNRLSSENSDCFLVDVRTQAEWNFVGIPELESIGKQVILEEWQTYPSMSHNPSFAERVAAAIRDTGGSEASEIYFLCRSGVRSQGAAAALTAIGFGKCFNVTGGFEGPPNEQGQRGKRDGWKFANLPWRQG